MKSFLFALLLASACLPHVEPAPRTAPAQHSTLAFVRSSCTQADPFDAIKAQAESRPPEMVNQIEWMPPSGATGVVISERHILTAAHAVRCPVIPRVHVTLTNGAHNAVVERDDGMFPHGGKSTDVARIEIAHAGRFELHVPPPLIREAKGGESCCAETLHGRTCGTIDPYHANVFLATGMRKGDSGAPVYCSEALVGVVTHTGADGAKYEPVTAYWLEGT